MDIRTGTGFDVHKFKKGRKLFLGGIEIPFEMGLQGHSDADVLLHALADALLGAAGLGDIGEYFPDNSSEYKDMKSSVILEKCRFMLIEKGYKISNADVTIIAEKPKISPFKLQIKKNIASLLKIEESRINVSATTTEKLGFTGRKEGIVSLCSVLIFKP